MSNPAVDAKRAQLDSQDGTMTMGSGVKARLLPIATGLYDEIALRIPQPEVPQYMNEEKGRMEENPNDPAYLRALQERAQAIAANLIDAMLLFGVELTEPIPNTGWEKKLEYIGVKIGSDPVERELAYKKYIAVTRSDLERIGRLTRMTEEDVQRMAASFPGKAERA